MKNNGEYEYMKNCKSCIYFREPMHCIYVGNEMKNLDKCSCWIDEHGNEC